jgi:hypothetical protein
VDSTLLSALVGLALNGGGILYLGRLYRDEKDKRIAEQAERYQQWLKDKDDQLAAERQAADERVAKERGTNAEVTRLWQERVNREVAATKDAEERCVAQAAAYEVKLAAAAERVDQLIGLGHAAVQTTRRVAGK